LSTLQPTFTLTLGSWQSTTANPVAAPNRLVVERDMDTPADALTLVLMERQGVALGDAVSLDLGHDGTEETVFTGTVVRLRPTLTGVQVQALGHMQDLLNLHQVATYEDKTAGSIAHDLIDAAALTAGTVESGPVLPRYAIDAQSSAFWHLKRLADRLGYELYGDRRGAIHFRALGAAANLDAAVGGLGAVAGAAASSVGALLGGGSTGYAFGQHLLAAVATQQQPAWAAIAVGGESPMSGQGDTTAHWLTTADADYRGAAGDGRPQQLRLDPVARTKDLADRFAAGQLAVVQRQQHQVQITGLGRPQVELGDAISTSAAPDALLNGNGYIRAIRHRFSGTSGFVTDLRLALGGEL
jgi:phage protein D